MVVLKAARKAATTVAHLAARWAAGKAAMKAVQWDGCLVETMADLKAACLAVK